MLLSIAHPVMLEALTPPTLATFARNVKHARVIEFSLRRRGTDISTMRLTKQTGHAIRILVDCALAGDQLVKVADISARLNVTKQNVFKIVHILSHAGFVTAVRGPSGGVRLAKPAAEIKVGDVVRTIEVTRVQVEGAPPARDAGGKPGPINAMFDDALSAFISVLDDHSLAELATPRAPLDVADKSGELEPASVRAQKARAKSPASRATRRS